MSQNYPTLAPTPTERDVNARLVARRNPLGARAGGRAAGLVARRPQSPPRRGSGPGRGWARSVSRANPRERTPGGSFLYYTEARY